MSERTRFRSVTFAHPFTLAGIDGEQQPGTYEVETTDVALDGLSFISYRRISTAIILPSPQHGQARRQMFVIDPRDLEAAEQRDARHNTLDRKSTRLNSSHIQKSRMPSSA